MGTRRCYPLHASANGNKEVLSSARDRCQWAPGTRRCVRIQIAFAILPQMGLADPNPKIENPRALRLSWRTLRRAYSTASCTWTAGAGVASERASHHGSQARWCSLEGPLFGPVKVTRAALRNKKGISCTGSGRMHAFGRGGHPLETTTRPSNTATSTC